MNGTLPLFEQCSGEPADKPAAAPARGAAPATAEERHLRAAWRLSRGMWRYPDHSPQQTRAGRAICHHLRALLAESQNSTPR